jgi:hypothetical protein
MTKQTLGQKLSPILKEIEETLLENYENQPKFTNDGFISASYIFQSAIMDKMFDVQEKENMPLNLREEMANKCGMEIRELIKKFCNIDSHDFYK